MYISALIVCNNFELMVLIMEHGWQGKARCCVVFHDPAIRVDAKCFDVILDVTGCATGPRNTLEVVRNGEVSDTFGCADYFLPILLACSSPAKLIVGAYANRDFITFRMSSIRA
jgi:hypothetical protein